MSKSGKIKVAISLAVCLAVAISAIFIKRVVEENIIYPIKYREFISKYSEQYGLDEALVCAVINTESHFDAEAVSAAGAIGLMQITPETFAWLQTKDDTEEILPDESLYDPEINIKYGALLLSLNIAEYNNVQTAIASYNAGRGKVSAWLSDERYSPDSRTLTQIPYEETRVYVEKVNRSYNVYKERLTDK